MRVLKKPSTIIFLIVAAVCFVYAAFTNVWYMRMFWFLVVFFIVCLAFEAFSDYVGKKSDAFIARDRQKMNEELARKTKKTQRTNVVKASKRTSSKTSEETVIQKLLGGYNSLEEMKFRDKSAYDKLSDLDKKHLQAQIDYYNSRP